MSAIHATASASSASSGSSTTMASAGGTSSRNPSGIRPLRCRALSPSQSHAGAARIQNAAAAMKAGCHTRTLTTTAKPITTAAA